MVYCCFNQITGIILITIIITIIINHYYYYEYECYYNYYYYYYVFCYYYYYYYYDSMIIIGDFYSPWKVTIVSWKVYCISGIIRRYYWDYLFGWLLLLVACGDYNRNTTNGIMCKTQQ